MISQVLNRQFVLEQLELVQGVLSPIKDEPRREAAAALLPDIDPAEQKKAAESLAAAQQTELANTSGQQGFDDDPEARRGEEAAPIDDTAFFSRDPAISLLQSALTEYFLTQAAEQVATEPTDGEARRSEAFDPVGAMHWTGATARPRGADGRRLFDRYSETDPRWIASVYAMGFRLLHHRHDFNPKPATPLKIGARARLILVGDWGSGLPRAVAVGQRMRTVVEQGRAAGLEQHVIHLGDVYYSGWEQEYRRNFLPHWPVKEGETSLLLRSWCLNGNHDMYAGGHAYYDFLLADPRFAAQERSSFFSLHNDHWDILGLDTAHDDAGLHDPQLTWIQELRAKSSRRSMFLSHHQLFSAYEKPSKPLKKIIGDYLLARPVDVWFWGHEHRCVFYNDSEGVRNARLIGHGGVPVYMTHRLDAAYPPPAFYEYRAFTRTLLEKWAYFGFAVVDLDGPRAAVRYIDEYGFEHKNEILS